MSRFICPQSIKLGKDETLPQNLKLSLPVISLNQQYFSFVSIKRVFNESSGNII